MSLHGKKWFDEYQEIVKLAEFMAYERGDSIKDILHMLNKPWHYELEYQQMIIDKEEKTNGE